MAGIDVPGIQVTIRGDGVVEMFRRAPAIVGKHLRSAFGQFAGVHRRELLGSLTGGYQRLAKRSVYYKVWPKQVGKAGLVYRFGARPRLEDIRLRIFATSSVTLIHEVGGTIRPRHRRKLAIPVKGTRNKITGIRKGPPPSKSGLDLVRIGSKLYERGTTKSGRDALKVRYLLTGAVSIKPALGILRTWARLETDRRRRLGIAMDAAAAEMAAAAAAATAAAGRAAAGGRGRIAT